MISLMVSYNAGMSYYPEKKAETVAELEPRCAELDEQYLRWYLLDEANPAAHIGRPCKIHGDILQLVVTITENDNEHTE